MARARMLKPEFFTDADLLALPPLTRILFAGLWCWADREGRLEDKPRDLKIRILPGDELDVDQALEELVKAGRIRRYHVNGQRCIWIVNFCRHQHVHIREAASTLPAPGLNGASTGHARKRRNKAGKDSASTSASTSTSTSDTVEEEVQVSVRRLDYERG